MKTLTTLLLLGSLSFSQAIFADGLLDSAKNLLADKESAIGGLNVTDMVSSVSDSLGIDQSQASGSLGAIFNYAKDNISKEQLSTVSDTLPGLDSLLKSVPAITGSEGDSSDKVGDLLSKAAKYSDSLGAVAKLQKQFESLGLDSEMIGKVIQSAYTYLNTEQGQQVKEILKQGLSSLKI